MILPGRYPVAGLLAYYNLHYQHRCSVMARVRGITNSLYRLLKVGVYPLEIHMFETLFILTFVALPFIAARIAVSRGIPLW